MSFSDKYQQALQSGYTPEEINQFLSKQPQYTEKYQQAIEAGYTPEEINQFLSSPKKENLAKNIGRQALRSGSRAVETVLGAPRAFGEAVESIIPEKLITKGAEKVGLKEPVQKGFEVAKKFAPYKLFPTSSQVQDVSKALFGESVKPQNQWEQKADNLISDFAALSIPIPGAQFKVLKPALLALGGNIASEAVGKIGGTEKQQTYAKLGTILLGSLFNPKGAEKFKNDLYSQARQARPADATTFSKSLQRKAENLEKKLKVGGIADSDKPALEKLDDIRREIQGDRIPVASLERLKVKINEELAGIYKKLEGNKPGIKSAKRNLENVSALVDEALNDYGKINPKWESFYRPANEAHGAIAQSKKLGNFLARLYKKLGVPSALALFGVEQALGAGKTGLALATGYGVLKVGELAARFLKSPTLRKYYINVVNAALKEDAVVAKENLMKLERELKKEE